MTHDILQTDIDLATKLKDDQHPDEDIVLALVQECGRQAGLYEPLTASNMSA